jgi:uncharacterized protein YbaP (TraB family)
VNLKQILLRSAHAAVGVGLALSLLSGCATSPATNAAPAPVAAAAHPAEPALWVIRDEDSTIYLFGTVHMLKPGTTWRTPRVEAAFNGADELVLELEDDDPAGMTPLIQQYGLDLAHPLSSKLGEEDRKRLAGVAQSLGIPVAQMEPLRPWLASLQIVLTGLMRAGFDPNAGVDKLLLAAARQAGKPVRAFETPEQQIRFFADLPPEIELDLLRQSLRDFEGGAALFDAIATGWAAGDVAAMERALVGDMRAGAPRLYQVIIVERNTDWANQIETRLKGKGSSFIAVGSAHLVGPDSVQAHLGRKGIVASRM